VDIAAGLAAATQAVSIARVMRDVEKAYDAVALKGQIIDLMDKLNDVRSALQDARDALDDKDRELVQLREGMALRATTVLDRGFRYTADPKDPTQPVGAPFCSRCDTVDGRLILTVRGQGRGTVCPQCKTNFDGARRYLWPEEREQPGVEASQQ
jgi:hypothetical protein